VDEEPDVSEVALQKIWSSVQKDPASLELQPAAKEVSSQTPGSACKYIHRRREYTNIFRQFVTKQNLSGHPAIWRYLSLALTGQIPLRSVRNSLNSLSMVCLKC
jgi:hypothetical protein